jgi:hypothetical protein
VAASSERTAPVRPQLTVSVGLPGTGTEDRCTIHGYPKEGRYTAPHRPNRCKISGCSKRRVRSPAPSDRLDSKVFWPGPGEAMVRQSATTQRPSALKRSRGCVKPDQLFLQIHDHQARQDEAAGHVIAVGQESAQDALRGHPALLPPPASQVVQQQHPHARQRQNFSGFNHRRLTFPRPKPGLDLKVFPASFLSPPSPQSSPPKGGEEETKSIMVCSIT